MVDDIAEVNLQLHLGKAAYLGFQTSNNSSHRPNNAAEGDNITPKNRNLLYRSGHLFREDIFLNLTKTLGWSEYIANTVEKGKPIEAAADYAISPVKVFDQIISNPDEAVKYMPVIGRMYYQWFGGGIEKDQERLAKKEYGEAMEEYRTEDVE